MIIPGLLLLLIAMPLARGAEPALTIYNQNFAVIRETVPLELRPGVNSVQFVGTTALVEPESVILRDPTGRRALQILEQNYRADPVSIERLLALYEGKTIDFLLQIGDRSEIVPGRIVRAGGLPPQPPLQPYGQPAYPPLQPIIEVNGKLRFQLPGTPLFPALGDGAILKPTLDWLLRSDSAGRFDAELCYVSGGIDWSADYNFIAPEKGDDLDLVGWVTVDNRCGKTFENAHIKLMAGDIHKLRPREGWAAGMAGGVIGGLATSGPGQPAVTQKTFEEYHLYTIQRPATLHDRETKQVEFVRASGVPSKVIYVYDGLKLDPQQYQNWNDATFGVQSNPKVAAMREIVNSQGSHLGMPLPAGRTRFYRRDSDGRLEFTGEDEIRHTPRNETIRLFTGAAFDLVGERRRTNFYVNQMGRLVDETYEIEVRNRKSAAVEVRVIEHMYRWVGWEIRGNSAPFQKTDAQTIEFKLPIEPDSANKITYTVHYTW
jgi:hypothetical protein